MESLLLLADLSGVLSTLWTITKVAAGLGFVIFVHELGHFLAAKACGVKCDKFYVGFDIPIKLGPIRLPAALCKFQWGETEYGIGILPLGGYVKMLGQDDDPANAAKEAERIRLAAEAEGGEGENATGEFELDPRSYPAKPVWQRMIIISAGVIMNVVSAVGIAAIAYKMGVSYSPCVLGSTAPGTPAWIAGLSPEDKILMIGESEKTDEHFRFFKDLMPKVMLHGSDQDLALTIRRNGVSEPEKLALKPIVRPADPHQRSIIGVSRAGVTTLSAERPYDKHRVDDEVYNKIKGGDEVIAVDGDKLPRNEQSDEIFAHYFEQAMASRVGKTITVTLLRKPDPENPSENGTLPQELEIELPPLKMMMVGLSMQAGPISAIRKGSPADKAGFQVGDVLLQISGQPVGNPMTIEQRLTDKVGEEIEIIVQRGGSEETLTAALGTSSATDSVGPGAPIAITGLGVAFPVESIVANVEADSPAGEAGIQAGDQLVKAQFVVPTDKTEEAEKLFGKEYTQPIEFKDNLPSWPFVHWGMQIALPNTSLKLTYKRGDKETEVTLTPKASDTWCQIDRGLNMTLFEQTHTAASWGEAWYLGYRETKEKLGEVAKTLKRLFQGKVKFTSFGGPISIAAFAGSEASQGIPRLLIFLTFLSANLAIPNFLPIPALDGGHMVFLAYEGIFRKPVDERVQMTLTMIGVGALLCLMIFVFGLDIDRFFF